MNTTSESSSPVSAGDDEKEAPTLAEMTEWLDGAINSVEYFDEQNARWPINPGDADMLRAILSALSTATARAERAEAALKQATTPDIVGFDDVITDVDDLYSLDLAVGAVVKVWTNRQLGDRWVVCYRPAPDAEDYEYALCETEAEARAKIEESARSASA